MPITAQQCRQNVGAFHRSNGGRDVSSHHAVMAGRYPRTPTLRLNSTRNAATALLPLIAATTTLRLVATTGTVPLASDAFEARPVMASPRPHTAAATASHTSATAPLLSAPVVAVSNGVLGLCVARPRHCGAALVTGALTLLGTGAVIGRELLAPRPPSCELAAVQAHSPSTVPAVLQDTLDNAVQRLRLPAGEGTPARPLELALLKVARKCDGNGDCRATAIKALLKALPPDALRSLQATVHPTGVQATASWPPGADASPLQHGDALDTLVEVLSAMYTVPVARFQDDLELIVGGDQTDTMKSIAAGRRQAVEHVLADPDHEVMRLPFTATSRFHGPRALDGINLMRTVRAPGAEGTAPARHLMLVAHGDMRGAELGSDGAYDNAAGVAALMHVLRGVQAGSLPADTALSVLVTDLEEEGLLGSAHFASECARRSNCPTLVINVDLVGRGGHGFLLSSTLEVMNHVELGRAPLPLAPPTLSDVEMSGLDALQRTFRAHGFQRHPPHGGVLMPSDNLAFSNVSIPTLGIAQMSAEDVRAMAALESARHRVQTADRAFKALDDQQGGGTLGPADMERLEAADREVDQAWHALRALRHRYRHSAVRIMHTGQDRVARVSPHMGVAFAEALLDVVRQWIAVPAPESMTTGSPAP